MVDGVAVVTIDMADSKVGCVISMCGCEGALGAELIFFQVNTLSLNMMTEFETALNQLETNPDIKAAVLISGT